jgi:hypothetical protein
MWERKKVTGEEEEDHVSTSPKTRGNTTGRGIAGDARPRPELKNHPKQLSTHNILINSTNKIL